MIANGDTHGFVLSKGVFTQIDVPGAIFTSVNGVNGERPACRHLHRRATGAFHGFFWSKGVFTTLDAPGSIRTSPSSSTRRGQVVGVIPGCRQRPSRVRLEGGHLHHDRCARRATATSVIGINDHGEVVGTYVDATATVHGFVLSKKGVYTTLDVPDADGFTVAQGINNAGDIRRALCGCQTARTMASS